MDERRAEYTVSSRDSAGWLRQLYPAASSVNLEYSDRVIQTLYARPTGMSEMGTDKEKLTVFAAVWDGLDTYQRLVLASALITSACACLATGFALAKFVANGQTSGGSNLVGIQEELNSLRADVEHIKLFTAPLAKRTPTLDEAIENSITALDYRKQYVALANGRNRNSLPSKDINAFNARYANQRITWSAYVISVSRHDTPDHKPSYMIRLSATKPNIVATSTAFNADTSDPKLFGGDSWSKAEAFAIIAWTDPLQAPNSVLENMTMGQKVEFAAVFTTTPWLVHFDLLKVVNSNEDPGI